MAFFFPPTNCSYNRHALARDKTVLDTTKKDHKFLVLKGRGGQIMSLSYILY